MKRERKPTVMMINVLRFIERRYGRGTCHWLSPRELGRGTVSTIDALRHRELIRFTSPGRIKITSKGFHSLYVAEREWRKAENVG